MGRCKLATAADFFAFLLLVQCAIFCYNTTMQEKENGKTPKYTEVVAALIVKDGRYLICRRPYGKARGGLWEFVGGKVEKGETKQQALKRECMEELAAQIDVGEEFCSVTHVYPDLTVHLTVFYATLLQQPHMLEHMDMKWILRSQTDDFVFCPADKVILEKIKEEKW